MIKDENIRITITISKEIHNKIKEEADFEDRSISNMVYKILKDHYNLKEEF
ncbi:hypothetical protein [Clostridium butyricum]|uniref:hypothetical protein n=1 Tax=Clostridium butyricum TaxID=1492 RepID=UPI000A51958E|nr:hypothetical protein [Clostridium butyricum]